MESLADSVFGNCGVVPELGVHFSEDFIVTCYCEGIDNIIVEGRDIVFSDEVEGGWAGKGRWAGFDKHNGEREESGGDKNKIKMK